MMNRVRKSPFMWPGLKALKAVMATVVLSSTLIACGGGDGDGGGGDTTTIVGTGVRGTTSTNRALASNRVFVKAASGEESAVDIGSNGRFQGQVMGEGPFLMRVDLGNSEFMYGLGFENSGVVEQNIHSYTDAVLRNVYALDGQNIDAVFNDPGSDPEPVTQTEVTRTNNSLLGIVGLVLSEYGVSADDLQTGSFDADNTGIDNFLKSNPVIINNGQITIIVNDPATNTQSVAASNVDLSTDITIADTQPPSTPMSVRPLISGAAEIVVVWEPAIDNIGVNAYQVFRDGALISTTPFPVFTDSGLTAGTAYNYAIVAVDAAGNESSQSMLATSQLLGTVDDTPPPAPDALLLTSTINSVTANWSHSDISDVVSFNVLRGTMGVAGGTTLLTNVTSTSLIDANVDAGTEYCYQVQAVDGSGNVSPSTGVMCTNTTGSMVTTTTPPMIDPAGPVMLSFAEANNQVLESSPSVVIAVNRIGDTSQEVSVDYTITGVTATEGSDYAGNNTGTLTWASGDGTPKNITIQILADVVDEGDETFTVVLSNVSGGATFGDITETTVTISNSVPMACTELETLRINEDTVLNLPCYTVAGNIFVNTPANLRIAAGVRMEFASGGGIDVDDGASLTAEGTVEAPIVLTGDEALPGFWQGVNFGFTNSVTNILDYVVIDYAGSSANGDAAVNIEANTTFPSRVSITNTTLRNSLGYGFNIDNGTTLGAFSNNTVSSNNSIGLIHPSIAGFISADNTFTDNTENVIEVISGTLGDASTWADINVPWLVDGLTVREEWTVDAGNELRLTSGARIFIDDDGAIIAVGTEANPILITGDVQSPGYWDGLELDFSPSTLNQLEYVTIEYAGTSSNSDAILSVSANSTFPSRLRASNLTLRHSATYGFAFDDHIELSQFDNVTSTMNVSPGLVSPDVIGSIGAGANFQGNTEDMLSVRSGQVRTQQTWPAINVPYLLAGVDVDDTLTLTAGSSLMFDSGAELVVDDGILIAQGTPGANIEFSGAINIPGYWAGIRYNFTGAQPNVLSQVVIRDAGGSGNSATQGNVEMDCNGTFPTVLNIDNAMITNGAGWGVFMDANGCTLDLGANVDLTGNAQGEINM